MLEIINQPLHQTFYQLVENSKDNIKLCAPFIKDKVIKNIYELKKNDVKIDVITNFNLQNFYRKSSDISAMEIIKQNQDLIVNNQNLHAKIYIFDNKYTIITSANLTPSGFEKNLEYGIIFDDKNLVDQTINDFLSIRNSDRAGSISFERINAIKKIINYLPKFTDENINHHNYSVEIDSTIEVDVNLITNNLTNWQLLTFKAINMIRKFEFTLDDIYNLENYFRKDFPNNNTVRASIRRNLQELRDLGLLKFCGDGKYKKLWK